MLEGAAVTGVITLIISRGYHTSPEGEATLRGNAPYNKTALQAHPGRGLREFEWGFKPL